MNTNTAPTFTTSTGKITENFIKGAGESPISLLVTQEGNIIVGGNVSYSTNTQTGIVRYNSDGTLDTSFSADGKVLLNSALYCIGIHNDGGLIVAQANGQGSSITRLNASGLIDSNFSSGRPIEFNGRIEYISTAADNSFLIIGTTNSNRSDDYYDITIKKYLSNGQPDENYGIGGSTIVSFGSDDAARTILRQNDGKTIIVGYSWINRNLSICLTRLSPNGLIDKTFGSEGISILSVGSSERWTVGNIAALDLEGRILVVAPNTNPNKFFLCRFDQNGNIDKSFSQDGIVTTDFNGDGIARSIAVQADGKILVSGWGRNDNGLSSIAVSRYTTDGNLDLEFGQSGKATYQLSDRENYGSNLAVVNGQKIVVSAEVALSQNGQDGEWWDFGLMRISPNGLIDSSFGPTINTLNGSTKYIEQSVPVVIDSDVTVYDYELSSSDVNYEGSTLTISRKGGASSQDVFSNTGTLTSLRTGSYFSVDGITIGRVTVNGDGKIILSFNKGATQNLVNKTLQQITYSNTSDTPPESVAIDWKFDDGNTGTQGSGGALSATGTSYIFITPTNDRPYLSAGVPDQRIEANNSFVYKLPAGTFIDPDLETLNYKVLMADGTGIPPWLTFNRATQTFSGTPTASDLGSFDLQIQASDAANESASDFVKFTVFLNIAPALANLIPDQSVILGQNLSFTLSAGTFVDVRSRMIGFCIIGDRCSWGERS
jgi:uncharacterized delta-60 repeat protein